MSFEIFPLYPRVLVCPEVSLSLYSFVKSILPFNAKLKIVALGKKGGTEFQKIHNTFMNNLVFTGIQFVFPIILILSLLRGEESKISKVHEV